MLTCKKIFLTKLRGFLSVSGNFYSNAATLLLDYFHLTYYLSLELEFNHIILLGIGIHFDHSFFYKYFQNTTSLLLQSDSAALDQGKRPIHFGCSYIVEVINLKQTFK